MNKLLNSQQTFSDSIYVQIRVIGALMVREMLTTYGRKNLGFLWLFLEPLIFIFLGVVQCLCVYLRNSFADKG
jgi:capsular polysaccharide transport system permease protein